MSILNNETGLALPENVGKAVWIALVVGGSVLFSLGLACAAPLAALAAIAGTRMDHRSGLLLVGAAWLANQGVGYGLLHYPRTWDSFAWGAVLGLSALAATVAARTLAQGAADLKGLVLGFIAAFVTYEALLMAAMLVLPGSWAAFAPAIVAQILGYNILALAVLSALHRAATAFGLLAVATSPPLPSPQG